MSKISRDDIKKKGIKRTLRTFKFSWQGLAYAYKNEQSMWVHAIASIITITIGFICGLTLTEWAVFKYQAVLLSRTIKTAM